MALIEWVLGNLPGFVAVLCAFGFIIFIHELGHFLAARRVGIRCPNFAIGFGPKLFGFIWRGTEFSVRLLPFGGYVQMLGEDPSADETGEEFKPVSAYLEEDMFPASRDQVVAALEARGREIEDPTERHFFEGVLEHCRWNPDRVYGSLRDVEGNFNDRTIPQRMVVVVGGVTMNFISALLLFWIVGASYGLVDLSQDSLPRVMKVYGNSPAQAAGLKYGDEVQSVNGVPVVSGDDMIDAIAKYPGQPIQITVSRKGEPVKVDITPNVLVAGLTFHPERTKDGRPQVLADAFGAPKGPAAQAGVKAGDVITAVNGQPVASVSELVEAFRAAARQAEASRQDPVKISLGRQGSDQPVAFEVARADAAPEGKIGIMPGFVTEFRFIADTTRRVETVAPGSAAAEAGIQPGDEIWKVNGRAVRDAASMDEILAAVSRKNEALGRDTGSQVEVQIARDGQEVSVSLPAGPAPDSAALGLAFQPVTFPVVVKHSFWLIGKLIVAPVLIVWMLIQNLLSPSFVAAGMQGPLGIMQLIFELSDQGLGKFLYVVALINAAVGAFNLIPFPALDGSRLLILGIGAVRRREVDYRLEAKLHYVGLMVLLAVVLLVTVMDVQRIVAGMPLTK